MKRKIHTILLTLLVINIGFSQCELEDMFIDEIEILDCCNDIRNFKNLSHDTTQFKFHLYNVICGEDFDLKKVNSIVDSFLMLEKKFMYAGTKSDEWKFQSNNFSKTRNYKKRIFEIGYTKSIEAEDYLKASEYSKLASKCYVYNENKSRKFWEELALNNFETYADGDITTLIEYHRKWLFWESSFMLKDRPFDGYHHLIENIQDQYTKNEFKILLDNAIDSASIICDTIRGNQRFVLEFKLQSKSFKLHDPMISRFYFQDTILKDTVLITDCYGKNSMSLEYIEIQNDTIKNQIDNLFEMSEYKNRMRRSTLYGIIEELEN